MGLGTALNTGSGATTYLQATTLLSPAGSALGCGNRHRPAWASNRSSLGYNTAWGTTCTLDAVGDQPNVNPARPATANPDTQHVPTSPLVDAIPVGAVGCGSTTGPDRLGTARPVDGNGDGTAACDIGDLERPTPAP